MERMARAQATALTLPVEEVVVATELAAAAVTVAKFAPSVVAAPAVEVVVEAAPGLQCQPYSALPPMVLLDQCFAAMRPSLDSSR